MPYALSSGQVTIKEERREVDLRLGMSVRHLTLLGPRGEPLAMEQRSLVSMDDPHLAVLETILVSLGWSGPVTLRAGIDAGVHNANVTSYVGSDTTHLSSPKFTHAGDMTLCEVQTNRSNIQIATAVDLRLDGTGGAWQDSGSETGRRYERDVTFALVDGEPAGLTKTAATFTSRDVAITSEGIAAIERLRDHGGDTAGAVERHQAAWRRLWQRFATTIDADPLSQLTLNLHVFHVLQTLSPHTMELDSGVPARGFRTT